MNSIMAMRMHAAAASGRASRSLLSRRERFSHPNDRSTIPKVRFSSVLTRSTSLPAHSPSARCWAMRFTGSAMRPETSARLTVSPGIRQARPVGFLSGREWAIV